MAPRVPRIATRQSRRVRGQSALLPQTKMQCPRNININVKKEVEKVLRARDIEKVMYARHGSSVRSKGKAMTVYRYVKSTKQPAPVQKKAMKKASAAARSEQQHRKNARRAMDYRKSQESSFWSNLHKIMAVGCVLTPIVLAAIAGLVQTPGHTIYLPPPPRHAPYIARFRTTGPNTNFDQLNTNRVPPVTLQSHIRYLA